MVKTFDRKLRSGRLNIIRKPWEKVYLLAQLKGVNRTCAIQVWTEGCELGLHPSMLVKHGHLSGIKNILWTVWARIASFPCPSVKISSAHDPWWKYCGETDPLRKNYVWSSLAISISLVLREIRMSFGGTFT
jgi:hypothetical protein